jgi:2-dehydropantoate 2-reductase
MRIAIMGSGGVGGYFGALLHRAGEPVWFIARGEHLRAMQATGLHVTSVLGDFTVQVSATDDPVEVGVVDLVVFGVKSYDTEAAAAQMRPLIGPTTTILCVQNGVDNEEKLEAIYGERAVLPGVVHIFSVVSEPGAIAQTGGPRRITFGEPDGSITPRVERVFEVFKKAEINGKVSTRILADLWEKFLLICALGGMTAMTRLAIGEIRSCPESWDMLQAVMEEVAAVARAKGIAISTDAVEQALRFTAAMPSGGRASLYHDLAAGRRLELDALPGAVIRYGEATGVATPMNRAIYAALKPYDMKARGELRVQ